MSMFEDNQYRWRETYFVLFDARRRPTLDGVRKVLSKLNEHYSLENATGDAEGRFESLTLLSPDDFAALDICFTGGEEVLEQAAALAEELGPAACEMSQGDAVKRILKCDARFDVLHFERIPDANDEDPDDEPGEMLDPSALLLVLGALAKLTGGLAIDPQAGTFLEGCE